MIITETDSFTYSFGILLEDQGHNTQTKNNYFYNINTNICSEQASNPQHALFHHSGCNFFARLKVYLIWKIFDDV